MKQEKRSIDPKVARRQVATFCMLISEYPDDKRIGGAASAALGAIAGEQLRSTPEFGTLLAKQVALIKEGNSEKQATAVRSIAEFLQDGNDATIGLFVESGGIEALFQALDATGENHAVRRDILDTLHIISSKQPKICYGR